LIGVRSSPNGNVRVPSSPLFEKEMMRGHLGRGRQLPAPPNWNSESFMEGGPLRTKVAGEQLSGFFHHLILLVNLLFEHELSASFAIDVSIEMEFANKITFALKKVACQVLESLNTKTGL
jgi:hypothetical protein